LGLEPGLAMERDEAGFDRALYRAGTALAGHPPKADSHCMTFRFAIAAGWVAYPRAWNGGAGGGSRTHTTLPSRDFKSLASTSSATSAFGSPDQLLTAFSRELECSPRDDARSSIVEGASQGKAAFRAFPDATRLRRLRACP